MVSTAPVLFSTWYYLVIAWKNISTAGTKTIIKTINSLKTAGYSQLPSTCVPKVICGQHLFFSYECWMLIIYLFIIIIIIYRDRSGVWPFPMRIRFCPLRFWLFCVHVRFWRMSWGNQRCTSRNQSTVSPRVTQLKNPLPHRRSSSCCPRCIIRQKIIWSCPSFVNRPIFGFGANSDFFDQILAGRQ